MKTGLLEKRQVNAKFVEPEEYGAKRIIGTNLAWTN